VASELHGQRVTSLMPRPGWWERRHDCRFSGEGGSLWLSLDDPSRLAVQEENVVNAAFSKTDEAR
jgi:hypothetical protein